LRGLLSKCPKLLNFEMGMDVFPRYTFEKKKRDIVEELSFEKIKWIIIRLVLHEWDASVLSSLIYSKRMIYMTNHFNHIPYFYVVSYQIPHIYITPTAKD